MEIPKLENLKKVHCVACNHDADEFFMDVYDYRLGRCPKCEMIYVNPRPTVQALSALYSDRARNPFLAAHFESTDDELPTLERLLRTLKTICPKGRLLEVGCGRGDLLRIAERQGYEVEGCDLETDRSQATQFPIHIGALADLALPKERFDIVVTRNTLEHLFDPNQEIKEIARVLKKNGYLYIKVPNVEFEHGLRCQLAFRKSHAFCPPWHLNHFNPKTLERILGAHGLRPVSWSMEMPTRHPSRLRNLAQKAGFALIEGLRRSTAGHLFPKPILVCIAQKQS